MIDHQIYFEVLTEMGYESFAVEEDGTVWTGTEDNKTFLDADAIRDAVIVKSEARVAARESAIAKLSALGLTNEEITALLGV